VGLRPDQHDTRTKKARRGTSGQGLGGTTKYLSSIQAPAGGCSLELMVNAVHRALMLDAILGFNSSAKRMSSEAAGVAKSKPQWLL
jgi:hypothetical protein